MSKREKGVVRKGEREGGEGGRERGWMGWEERVRERQGGERDREEII